MPQPALERDYYLSLGSNLGDRREYLAHAVDFLNSIGRVLKKSALYETTPQGMEVETGLFYNMALSLRSTLAPDRLLAAIKSFEHHMGRDVAHSHNLPRTVDIDILMMAPYPDATDMGKGIYKTVELEIPHPRMTERAFVLVPLSEIAPAVLHPVRLQTIAALLAQLPQPIAGITPVLTVPS